MIPTIAYNRIKVDTQEAHPAVVQAESIISGETSATLSCETCSRILARVTPLEDNAILAHWAITVYCGCEGNE